MLKKLTIHNYALIESLDIDFPDGLIIITGETGAGKSILLGALSLLLGAKGDISALKDPTVNCVVEGEFDITGCRIDTEEICGETDTLILRRVIATTGRSRSFINDEPVSLSVLSDISRKLVDIHAQHEHLLLTDKGYQLSVLDYFAGTKTLLDKYKEVYNALQYAQTELKRTEEEVEHRNQEAEYKQFQLTKLEEAELVPGELDILEQEQSQLANAEEIREAISNSLALLQPMGHSIVQNLKEASQLLRKCYTFVPEMGEFAQRLEECRIECKDIEQELEKNAVNIVVSPERLLIVEDRIALLEGLFKRYGCSSVEELIAYREKLREELDDVQAGTEEVQRLRKRVEQLMEERNLAADHLTQQREGQVETLTNVLKENIRRLEMPHAEFEVRLTPLGHHSVNGQDDIQFLFSANGGNRLVEISKVASGGELSRIMLCMKALMATYIGMPTMIFDEIDTGVSGSIADKMGELIGDMGENMQVFAITHLPQIAAKGDTHLLVYKEFDKNKQAQTKIKLLDRQERVLEVARMLSGAQLSEAAIENAKFLLK